jgi:type II secretory pathway pseudopilin PulG
MGRMDEWRAAGHTIEEQLADLRQQVTAAEAALIDREAELADLRAELFAFRLRYDARVGSKVAELEEIEARIERCRERIDQYRKWGPKGPPHLRAGATYIPVEEQYRRAWQQPQEPPSLPPARAVDAPTQARMKKLYRQLCRRFHPDLTQDPEERAWRTEVMAAINAAYQARNLAELQALAVERRERREGEEGKEGRVREEGMAALRDRLEQIRRRLGEVEQEIRGLTNSQTLQMSLDVKLARRQGRDLLAEMSVEVEADLERKRAELDWMVAQLKQLGIAGE